MLRRVLEFQQHDMVESRDFLKRMVALAEAEDEKSRGSLRRRDGRRSHGSGGRYPLGAA
jgi:hypothetical protein